MFVLFLLITIFLKAVVIISMYDLAWCLIHTVLSSAIVSDSLRSHGLQPARLLCP